VNTYIFFIGIIATLLIAPLFLFINQAIVINNSKAINSIKKSIKIGKKNYFQVLALMIIFALLGVASGLIPYIGTILNLFLIAPLGILSYTALYLRRR